MILDKILKIEDFILAGWWSGLEGQQSEERIVWTYRTMWCTHTVTVKRLVKQCGSSHVEEIQPQAARRESRSM